MTTSRPTWPPVSSGGRWGLDWDYLRVWASTFAEIAGREEMPDQIERLWGQHAES